MLLAFSLVDYILASLLVVAFGWVIYLHVKLRRLTQGTEARSLEGIINEAREGVSDFRKFEEECFKYFQTLEHRLGRAVQAVETARFNPFKGTGDGGNQSSTVALISENGDGVVITSWYARDRVSVYSKPIATFQSEHDLTEEEISVVEAARKKLQTK